MNRVYVSRILITLLISLSYSLSLVYAQSSQLDSAYGAKWSPDGRILAISSKNGVWLYNIITGKLEQISERFSIYSWTFDNRIFTGTGFFNPVTRQIEGQFKLQQAQSTFSTPIGLSQDTKSFAMLEGNYLDTIAIYNTTNGELIRRIATNNPNAGPQIAWSPDDSRFAMLRPNKPTVLLIPNTENPNITEFSIVNSSAYQSGQFPVRLKWSPNGQLLAIAASPSTIFILDVQNGKFVSNLEGQASALMAWSPDSTLLAVTDGAGAIGLFDVKTGATVESYHTGGVNWDIEFSPFGGQLAVANDLEAAKQNGSQVAQHAQSDIQQSGVYARSIGIDNAVQLFVPAPSHEKLQAIMQVCRVQPNVRQSLTAQITSNKLQTFANQLSTLTDTQILPGCKADLLAVTKALSATAQ